MLRCHFEVDARNADEVEVRAFVCVASVCFGNKIQVNVTIRLCQVVDEDEGPRWQIELFDLSAHWAILQFPRVVPKSGLRSAQTGRRGFQNGGTALISLEWD